MKKFIATISFGLVLLLSAVGCVSTVKVTSDQGGALIRVRGKGRPSYRWITGPMVKKPGDVESFTANYSTIEMYAIWPDGVKSEHVVLPLSNWEDPETVKFVKPKK